MGRCLGCKKQTQNFCFVDQEFVCVNCFAADQSHARCVAGSYREWVQDSSYRWPPICSLCSMELLALDAVQRLTCLVVVHMKCLLDSPTDDRSCPHCEKPLLPEPGDKSRIADQLRGTLKGVQWAEELVELRLQIDVDAARSKPGRGSTEMDGGGGGGLPEAAARGNGLPVESSVAPRGQGSGVDLENGVRDGVPATGDAANRPQKVASAYASDDKEWKARQGVVRRKYHALRKLIRSRRRQVMILLCVLLCIAIAVYGVSVIMRSPVITPAQIQAATASFQQRVMSESQKQKLLSRYRPRSMGD